MKAGLATVGKTLVSNAAQIGKNALAGIVVYGL